MKYVKLTIQLTPFDETASSLMMAQLGECGFDSFTENETGFEAYALEDNFDEHSLASLDPYVDGVSFSVQKDIVCDEDWNKEWEENSFKPIVIDDRCRIRSQRFEADDSYEFDVVLSPKMSFGSGYHETTTMMIRYIMQQPMSGLRVLDMGCGTGILGIMASKCGAHHVDCIDIDPWSYENAILNASLNDIHNLEAQLGDAQLLSQRGQVYDVVLANINRNILTSDMHRYVAVLKPGGHLMLSGFYSQDADCVVASASSCGMKLVETKVYNDWNALMLVKVQ